MKVIVVGLLIVLISIGCDKKKEDVVKNELEVITSPQEIEEQEALLFDDLDALSKSTAIKKYGKPSSQERFVLSDMLGEFHVELMDFYDLDTRVSETILIDEYTWEKDEETWITVWYEVSEEDVLAKHLLIWEKGSEF